MSSIVIEQETVKKSLIWDKPESEKSTKKPTSREGFAFVYCEDKNIYLLFAGVSHIRYSDVFSLNRENWRWNQEKCTGEIPKELSYCAYWYDAPYLFFNGGRNKEISLSDTYFLNTNNWEWRKVFTMDQPSARFHHAAIRVHNKQEAYIFGGFGEKANKCLGDLCKFDYSKIINKNTIRILTIYIFR